MFDYQAPPRLLENRIVLVTGAGDGIGRAAALSYAAHGATVILVGRTLEKLEKVYDEIEDAGGAQPAIMPMDLAKATDNDFQQLAQGVENEFGKLHGILHNAGTLGLRTPIQAYPLSTWEEVLRVNLTSAFGITRHLLGQLQLAEDASVIFTSSTVGRTPRAYWGAYAVAKAGLEALMQVLHQELEKTSKVRVNSVNPGATRTRMRVKAFPAENPETLPRPEELMNLYLYLMGPDSLDVSGRQFDAQ